MDVVALAQYGIGYSVATLGTATSSDHIDRLYRLVPQIVFCFDGDTAGRNAGWKALLEVLRAMSDGRSARFLFVPDGEDPDSLIRKEGKDKFELRIERATSLDEFFFSHLEEGMDMESMEARASLSQSAMPLLNMIPEGVFKQLMIDRLSEKTGLEPSRLIEAAGQAPGHSRSVPSSRRSQHTPGRNPGYQEYQAESVGGLAEFALAMLVKQPELAQEFEESVFERLIQVSKYRLLGKIALLVKKEELLSPGHLMSHFQGEPEFHTVRDLINQEQLLGVAELREEFRGTITRLLERFEIQLKQELIEQLLEKPFSELTEDERQLIKSSIHGKP
jgi:DNA primase